MNPPSIKKLPDKIRLYDENQPDGAFATKTTDRTTEQQIDTFCMLLKEYATDDRRKHLRLGQMISNAMGVHDIYNMETTETIAILFKEISK